MKCFRRVGWFLGMLFLAPVAMAVEISDAWARATVPGQTVGAAYLTITSPRRLTLVAVKTALAARVEIHSAEMKDGIMKMRRLDSLDIPAGVPVVLAPMGIHLMLMELNAPLKADDRIPLELIFKDKRKKKVIKVGAPVRAITQSGPR